MTFYTTFTTADGIKAAYIYQTKRQLIAAIRTAAGWTTAIMFFLVLGKAGASDCGAPMEEIFPSTFIYMGIAIISFYVWEACGGNRPYNNKYNRRVEK